jgi:hypothetical protein
MTLGNMRANGVRSVIWSRKQLPDWEGLVMTITVLLMTILTGQNHTVVAEYDTPQACEAAAQAHQKVLLGNDIRAVYTCSPKAGSR